MEDTKPEEQPIEELDEEIDEVLEKKLKKRFARNPYDMILNLMVNFVEGEIAPYMPIVLNVKGAIIGGNIISQKQYLEMFADGAIVKTLNEEIEKGNAKGGMPKPGKYPHFIHLADAKFVTPGVRPIEVGLWRGRINSIDGYALGTLNVNVTVETLV
jgi:hypothetical protein